MSKLANHVPPGECPTVGDWVRAFDRYLESDDQQIAGDLVKEARDLFQHLEKSQSAKMFLHGDLQHYNVLRDEVRGWLAIDPKGVVAELEYEIGSILRNPVELAELVIKPTAISRRLSVLTTELRPNHGLGVLPGSPLRDLGH